jgi:hypothetical protein
MTRKPFAATFLAVLLMSLATPLVTYPSIADTSTKLSPATVETLDNNWLLLNTEKITILFPAGGKHPMFLWWYTNDTSRVYVVKYQGLIEYFTYDNLFYKRIHEAVAEKLRERFIDPKEHKLPTLLRNRVRNMHNFYNWHLPMLHFNTGRWELSGPVNITKGNDVIGVGFNFTLVEVHQPRFGFAENNIIIRCRFYYESTTETAHDNYTYTVDAGELKMDLVIKHWEWNVDKINDLIDELAQYDIIIPKRNASLALWINLASLNITKLELAKGNPENIETMSNAQNMIVEGKAESVVENKTLIEDEHPMNVRKRISENYRVSLAKTDGKIAGFFKFVASALHIDPVSGNVTKVVPVKAAYIPAGHHMRLFIGYEYFGNQTLEHDPLLGLEEVPSFISLNLVVLLIVATVAIASVVAVLKWRRKTINVVGVH